MIIDIPTNIINLSLGMLNVTPIVDINSDELDSQRIKEQVKITRKVALAEHPFGFARKKLPLSKIEENNGYYVLPADFIQALKPTICEEYSRLNSNTYLYERLVKFSYEVCNSEILYIFNAPFELWDAYFTNFFIKKLAFDIAILFGKDPNKMQLLASQLELEKISMAKRYTANYTLTVNYGDDDSPFGESRFY